MAPQKQHGAGKNPQQDTGHDDIEHGSTTGEIGNPPKYSRCYDPHYAKQNQPKRTTMGPKLFITVPGIGLHNNPLRG